MPGLLLLLAFLGTSAAPMAQTTLAPGDLVVLGTVSDNPDAFSLLATVDIATGTEFKITDKGVGADGTIQPERESIRTFTTTAPIAAGDVFVASADAASFYPEALGTPTGGTSFLSLSDSGDQLIIYQGETSSPTFIYAFSSTPFDPTFDPTNGGDPTNVDQYTTALPPGLVNGTTAVDFDPQVDNLDYDRTKGTSGTRAEILALVTDDANYTVSNDRFTLQGGAFTITTGGGSDPALIITGVVDGPLANGTPKAVELYVVSDVADLSRYGIGSANNGGGTDGVEYVLSGSASAGDYIHITDDNAQFNAFFGFDADFDVPGSEVSVNGDDAIELFYDPSGLTPGAAPATAAVIDVFGEISGGPGDWNYLDGWAYRKDATGPDGSTFDIGNWSFSGVNALDGETTNATASTPFPIGTYSSVASPDPTARLQVIHNSPDPAADTVDVYVNDALFLNDVAFREATGFQDVPAGVDLKVDVTASDAADNASPVYTATYNLTEDVAYQLIATGVVGEGFSNNPDGVSTGFTLLVGADARETATDASKVEVRVVHGAPDAPTVDVRAGETVLVDDAAYGDVTDYIAVDPTMYTLDITTADGSATAASFTADLTGFGGSVATVLASGFLTPADDNDGPAFGLLVVLPDGTSMLFPVVVSLAEARALGVGASVTFEGTVTRTMGDFTYVQSEGAGLTIRQPSGAFADSVASGAIAPGTTVRVTGKLSEFQQLLQIDGGDLTDFEITGTADVPEPQVVTLAQLASNGEDYEGELVTVTSVTFADAGTFAAGTAYQVTDDSDASNAVSVYVPNADDTTVDGEAIPVRANLTAIVGQSDVEDPAAGYQLLLIDAADIENSTAGEENGTAELSLAVANPLRGAATVRFSLDAPGAASVSLYDALGRRVLVVAEGEMTTGGQTARLEAGQLASGVYILRLEAETGAVNKTITVVR